MDMGRKGRRWKVKCCIVHKTELKRKTYLEKILRDRGEEVVYYTTDKNKAKIFDRKPDADKYLSEHELLVKFAEVQKA